MKAFVISLFLFTSSLLYAQEGCDVADIEDYETRNAMQNWLNGDFGLKPHYANYLLPYGYRFGGNYQSFVPSDTYKKVEAEMQISLKLNIGHNAFGLGESYNLSYSHTAFWQIYTNSSPFREINYNPEFFVIFPIQDDSIFHLSSWTFALAHISNGQGNVEEVEIPDTIASMEELSPYLQNRSRSVNYLYTTLEMQHRNLLAAMRVWIPYFGEDLADNPDLIKYYGFTRFYFRYFYGKHLATAEIGGNPLRGRSSLTATYSYPIYDDVYFYSKFFTGYGESMIDYNNYITKLSFGFSFSR
jgi:phospholipase A1